MQCAFSPDGKRIVTASEDNTVKVWEADKGQELLTLKGHTVRMTSVVWSPDSKRIVAGSEAWSPDGERIVAGSDDKMLMVWDADKGQEPRSLKGHTDNVSSVAWSPDGNRISGEDKTGKVLTWDATTGQLLPGAEPVSMREQTEAVSPDGSQRAFIENGQIKVVLIEEQKRQQALERAFLERLARPDPQYHRHRTNQSEKSGDLFAAAFHLRRLLLIAPKEDVPHTTSQSFRVNLTPRRRPIRRCRGNCLRRCLRPIGHVPGEVTGRPTDVSAVFGVTLCLGVAYLAHG